MKTLTRRQMISGTSAIALGTKLSVGSAQNATAACSTSISELAAEFPDFEQHIATLRNADYSSYQNIPDADVGSSEEFERIRQDLLDMYEPMTPSHSFMDEDGQIWDVIPVGDQPSLRESDGTKRKAALEPDASYEPDFSAVKGRLLPMPFASGRRDTFGNEMFSAKGYIPFKRQTLTEIFRDQSSQRIRWRKLFDGGNHAYAIATQKVSYVGAGGLMSIFGPDINDNQTSISQIWISAGTGGGLQTIESGAWSNCDFGTSKPTFFVLGSSDNYNVTCQNQNKCHNSQTGKSASYGFVYKNNVGLAPGATFPKISPDTGDAPFLFGMNWIKHESGNWWLWIEAGDEGGTQNGGWIGYFPKEIFAGGPLATAADTLQFGGETAIYSSEKTYAPMGNGKEPTVGISQQGAFHIQTFYRDADLNFLKANLIADENISDNCFGVIVEKGNQGSYNSVYFGGPGGINCPA